MSRRAILPLLALLLLAVASPASAARKPDLKATKTTASPMTSPGGLLDVTLTVRRAGGRTRSAGVKAYLSSDRRRSKDDVALAADVRVRALRGRARTASTSLRALVPAATAAGARHVVACVDDPSKLRERDERNNCKAAGVTIGAADAARTSRALIDADRAANRIDAARALQYRVFAAMRDPRLPKRYAGPPTAEEDDGVMREVASAWPTLPPSVRKALARNLVPPPLRDAPAKKARAKASQDDPDASMCAREPQRTVQWKTLPAAGGKVLLNWDPDHPEHGKNAADIAAAVTAAYGHFKQVMGREPLGDGDSTCYHGVDGALDIYIDPRLSGADGYTIPVELRRNHKPDCEGMASFIIARPNSKSFTTRFVFAHELFHAFQNAFPYRDGCEPYSWFDEASANWAAHAVFPDDDSEHFFRFLLESPGTKPDWRDYHTWPLVLWMEKRFGDASIRKTYENFARMDSVGAVDAAIGGLRKHYLDFAEQAWNQDPLPTFKQWDRYDAFPDERGKPYDPAHLFLLGAPTRKAFAPVDIGERARAYLPYVVTDEDVREIAYRNPLAGDPDFRVGAILTLADGTTRVEDWSGKQSVKFCRDQPEQNIASMVIVYASSSTGEDHWVKGEPELNLRDSCQTDDTWRYKVLSATLQTHTDGMMPGSNMTLCGMIAGLPIHGKTTFTAVSADQPIIKVEPGSGGMVSSKLSLRAPAKSSHDLLGCQGISNGGPITSCAKSIDRTPSPDGRSEIGFILNADSKQAETGELNWFVGDPSVGFVDFQDSVCNVQGITQHLDLAASKQSVPLSQFAGTEPFTLVFEGEKTWSEDALGWPATISYTWNYSMSLQRVDAEGNPL